MSLKMHVLLWLSALLPGVFNFTAYQCSSSYQDTIKYDALEMENCELAENWEQDIEDVDIQMLQEKFTDDVDVITCSLQQTWTIGACGFTSLLYGIPQKPIIDEPYILSAKQCERLYHEKILEYDNQEFPISRLDAVSADITMHGTKRDTSGYCGKATAFSLRGKTYPNNWAVVTMTGRVTRQRISFDTEDKVLPLEGRQVSLERSRYEGEQSTFIWDLESQTCLSTMEEVYNGPARVIIPRTKNFKKQVLIQHHLEDITFGLDLKEEKQLCGYKVIQTQLPHIVVILHRGNFIDTVEKSLDLRRTDKLVGLLTFNYISRTGSFTDGVRNIAQNTCLNSRSLILHRLDLLKEHPDSVIQEIFGKGYSGMVLGECLKMIFDLF